MRSTPLFEADAVPKILRAVCESLGWEVGGMWRVDPAAGVLRCTDLWYAAGARVAEFEALSRSITFAPGVGLPGRVWADGRPAWIPDVVHDDNFPRAPVADREGLHAAFGFPVAVGGETLGVMEFFSRQIEQPDAYLLQMLTAIGSQIGQFMKRKRAEEELTHERYLLTSLVGQGRRSPGDTSPGTNGPRGKTFDPATGSGRRPMVV